MAGKYSRVLVHIRKTSQGPFEAAKFSDCILDKLGIPSNGCVNCHLVNNQLRIQPLTQNSSGSDGSTPLLDHQGHAPYKIMHPPFCPVQHLDEDGIQSLLPEISSRGIDVGVAVLLESDDRHLLLTRRAAHMRTFPGVWVPPGGHVEDGETLEEAVLRELEEETGLVVSEEDRKSSCILGLWESVYPPILAMGSPKRHHVVVYLHVMVSRSSKDLISSFKLCPEEVDAATWLSHDLVKVAVWSPEEINKNNEEKQVPVENHDDDEEIYITLVNQEGEHVSGTLDASILRNRVPTPGLDIERISTGSRFALSLWLEKQASEDLGEATHENLYKKYTSHKPLGSSTVLKNKM